MELYKIEDAFKQKMADDFRAVHFDIYNGDITFHVRTEDKYAIEKVNVVELDKLINRFGLDGYLQRLKEMFKESIENLK